MHHRLLLTIAGAILFTPTLCTAQEKEIVKQNNIVYGVGDGVKLELNLAKPKNAAKPLPAIVCIHGGGWRMGHRRDMNRFIDQLAKEGFVAITASYRLAPKYKFPAQIHDCKAAVRWLRANAKKYNVDPDRIGTVGFSAGGHLACLLGSADKKADLEGKGGNPKYSSRVQAVVSFFDPTDFTEKLWEKQVEDFFFVPFLGTTFAKNSAPYKKCSPIVYVTKDDPPYLFIHGDKDKLVPIAHSIRMMKRLKAAGVSAELLTMKDAAHGWGGAKLERTVGRTIRFFKEKLSK